MKIRDARALALEAVARGWMSTAELWELATRWVSVDSTGASPEALFEGTSLDPLRLASLVAEGTNEPQTIRYSEDHEDSKDRDTEPRRGGSSRKSEAPPTASQPPGPRYKLGELLGAGG